ncbi:MAG: serine protease [Deltaproteobacteria bacterium]|nr:serine protease [Deltaproteobacteria bacterium]
MKRLLHFIFLILFFTCERVERQATDVRFGTGSVTSNDTDTSIVKNEGTNEKQRCSGRYADSPDFLKREILEFEKSQKSNYAVCIRNTTTYEQIFYSEDGKINKRLIKYVIHGTAFPIERKGDTVYFLTNEHVANQPFVTNESNKLEGVPFGAKKIAESIKIVQNEDDTFEKNFITLKITAIAPELDAAILEGKVNMDPIPYKFGLSSELKTGNFVMIKGFPLGIFNVSNTGKVINVNLEDNDGEWHHKDFVIDAQLNTGQSGSPVFAINCETGEYELVGLYHAFYPEGKGLNLAVGIDELVDFIKSKKSIIPNPQKDLSFLNTQEQFKIISYLLDPKNLKLFQFGDNLLNVSLSKDRTVTIDIYTERFPTYTVPAFSLIDRHIKGYGDVDELIIYRSFSRKEVIYNWEFSEELKKTLNEVYREIWLQIKRTIEYRNIVPIGSESEDYNKSMQSRYNEIKKMHDKQAQKLEQVLFEIEKIQIKH